jgi:hypothetical protein
MSKDTFNMRNPDPGEVVEMHNAAKQRRAQKLKFKVIQELLSGKTSDISQSPLLFEALNKEKMEFEMILRIHPEQTDEAIKAVVEDREMMDENKYWNKDGAKWATLGHIPPCVYYARPPDYWNDKRIIKAFFNMFTKFRISTKPI